MGKIINNDILQNWETVNEWLRGTNDEERVWALIKAEKRSKHRTQILLRLYGKASKLRMQRERKELMV